MSGGSEEAPDEFHYGQYPADFFDFIVIDECHRGGANDESNWRAIMDYFSPAVQLGLTATPRRDTNVDTYNYFGDPVYIYSLKEGVEDGFLTPFRVKQVSSDLDTYKYKEGDVILEGEVDRDKTYTESELNRSIVIEDREKFRVQQFMDDMDQNDKSLVFCRTQRHASLIRNLINQYADSKSPNYCHRVTADDGAIGEQHLRDFQDNEKSIPTVLTTSQKLSTGVDAPEVRNIVLLRPVNSMIEFKQIVGRGTRLFDGKDYFTIYDFVEAHYHFQDPEWDGEPEPCDDCGNVPCTCEITHRPPCAICNQKPCACKKPDEDDPCEVCGYVDCVCEKEDVVITRVKLADGSTRNINTNIDTTFWGPDGNQITSQDFLNMLFGDLPNFFKQEEQLRKIWSKPDTRNKLLKELEEAGYSIEQLRDLQVMIDAQKSDLFDVLSYIAFNKEPLERTDRANHATIHLDSYDQRQQAFLDFVLKQYIDEGVGELDDQKLPDLLSLKYQSIADAKQELGEIQTIRNTFIDFQKYLYETSVA